MHLLPRKVAYLLRSMWNYVALERFVEIGGYTNIR